MSMRLGVVGGTALASLDSIAGFEPTRMDDLRIETPWGEVPLRVGTDGDATLVFLQRHHGPGGRMTPPHRIEHRANLHALGTADLDLILSICGVGTMDAGFPPGTIDVAIDQIDLTGVAMTFHDEEAVFTSMTTPFHQPSVAFIRSHLDNEGSSHLHGQVYALMQGPHFESPAEIKALQRLGATAVGMTMPRESKLVAELGVPYVAVLVASNWVAGCEPGDPQAALDHEAVAAEANTHLPVIRGLIAEVLRNNPTRS